ncbi:MAG: hypothetical protein ACE5I1_31240, partial [bacterium]
LDQLVKECTAELNEANIVLKQEISEHKLTEAALKSSEERLRILLENIPDGYYLNDLKGTF